MPDFLDSSFLNGLYIIPILAVLIIVHEIGHFATARMVGVKVEEFGLGIPPRAKGWEHKGVLWSLNWIPFGGFVRVLGEDGANMEPGSMNTKSPGQRAFFLAAGSAMNFLLAILLMILVVGIQGVSHDNVYVDDVRPGSPAEQATMRVGDQILAVDGDAIDSTDELIATTRDFLGEPMPIVVERDGARLDLTVTPREDPPANEGPTGVGLSDPPEADVFVESVTDGSLAADAALRPGDRITAIAGHPIADGYAFRFEMALAEGQTVPMVVDRDGAEQTVRLAIPTVYPRLTDIEADAPAAIAGWQAGDRLLRIEEKDLARPRDLLDALEAAGGRTVAAVVQRDGAEVSTQVAVPALEPNDNVLDLLGVNVDDPSPLVSAGMTAELEPIFEHVSTGQVVPTGLRRSFTATRQMVAQVRELITNRDQWDQVAGPIGMGQITSYALEVSPFPVWVTLANLAIILSLNLGVLNLLPLPALDGGRLLFVIVEVLRGGRRIAPEKEGVVHFVGLVLLLGLMGLIAFADVNRLLSGTPFGS